MFSCTSGTVESLECNLKISETRIARLFKSPKHFVLGRDATTEDGPEFSGWWFGDSVGGQQVWSRSVEKSEAADKAKACDSKDQSNNFNEIFLMMFQVPPSRGWRVPWDAECVEGLLIAACLRDAIALNVLEIPIPTRLEAITTSSKEASRLEAIALMLEAIAIRGRSLLLRILWWATFFAASPRWKSWMPWCSL